jgi:NAD(P)H-flavin reductase
LINSKLKIKKNFNETLFCEIKLVGPFGTDTRHVFKSEHVILIASGIGMSTVSEKYRYIL